jgi:DNA polymerase zeta
MKRNPDAPSSQYVRAIVLVKGVHFYGFHSSWSPFLKIIMGDPALVPRAVTILQSGTVMQTQFRIFESHLSFILQFMSDFGLYGCGWMELGEVFIRGGEGDDEMFDSATVFSNRDTDGMQFERSPHFRQSRMPLEVDIAAHQILNRYCLSARSIHHKLEIPAPPLPDEPVVLGVRELWEDERNRRIAKGLTPSPEMPIDPSEGSREPGGNWVAEARWWDELNKRIEREMNEEAIAPEPNTWERWVMTTFESVEAVWDEKWKVWKPRAGEDNKEETEPLSILSNPYSPASGSSSWDHKDGASQKSADVDVDESKLSSQEIDLAIDGDEGTWDGLRKDGNIIAVGQHKQIFDEDPENDLPRDLEHEDEEQYQPQTPEREAGLQVENDGGSVSYTQFDINVYVFLPLNMSDRIARSRIRDEGSTSLPEVDPHIAPLKASRSEPEGIHVQEIPTKFSEDKSESRPLKKARIGPQTDLEATKNFGTPDSTTSPSSHPTERTCPTSSFSQILASEWETFAFVYARQPPLASELLSSMDIYRLPTKIYRNPYYSKASDAPERPREYAGLIYHLKGGNGLAVLEPWDDGTGTPPKVTTRQLDSKGIGGWEFASTPPSVKVVRSWMESTECTSDSRKKVFQQTSQVFHMTSSFSLRIQIAFRSRDPLKLTLMVLNTHRPLPLNSHPVKGKT